MTSPKLGEDSCVCSSMHTSCLMRAFCGDTVYSRSCILHYAGKRANIIRLVTIHDALSSIKSYWIVTYKLYDCTYQLFQAQKVPTRSRNATKYSNVSKWRDVNAETGRSANLQHLAHARHKLWCKIWSWRSMYICLRPYSLTVTSAGRKLRMSEFSEKQQTFRSLLMTWKLSKAEDAHKCERIKNENNHYDYHLCSNFLTVSEFFCLST